MTRRTKGGTRTVDELVDFLGVNGAAPIHVEAVEREAQDVLLVEDAVGRKDTRELGEVDSS